MIVLCKNCYNLLKCANISVRNRTYFNAYRHYVFSLQGNGMPGVRYDFLQRSVVTSVQPAVAPIFKKKKKGVKDKKSNASAGLTDENFECLVSTSFASQLESTFPEGVVESNFSHDELNHMFGTEDPLEYSMTEPEVSRSEEIETLENVLVAQSETQKKAKKKSKKAILLELQKAEEIKAIAVAAKKLNTLLNLSAYVDACLQLDQFDHAHKTVMAYLGRGKKLLYHGVDNVSVFNLLLKYAAHNGKLKYVKYLIQVLKNENIPLDGSSYLAWLVAIGREKSLTGPELQTVVREVMEAMKKQEFQPEELFLITAPSNEERELITKMLPDISLKPFSYPVGYSCKLLQGFGQITHSPEVQPLAGAEFGMNLEELQQCFFAQLSLERDLVVKVKSVVPEEPRRKKLSRQRVTFMQQKLQEHEEMWRQAITSSFKSRLHAVEQTFKNSKKVNIGPYLKLLSTEEYVDLIMNEIRMLSRESEKFEIPLFLLRKNLGFKVMQKHMINIMKEEEYVGLMKPIYNKYLSYVVDKSLYSSYTAREYWQHLLKENGTEHFQVSRMTAWPFQVLFDIGRFLYDIMINEVKISSEIQSKKAKGVSWSPALFTMTQYVAGQYREDVKPHRLFVQLYRESELQEIAFDVASLPMLCPPLPWININIGGFLLQRTMFMRIPDQSMHMTVLKEHTSTQQLYPIFDSLNNLSICPWIINKPVLDMLIEVFNKGGDKEVAVSEHPLSLPLPPEVSKNMSEEEKKQVKQERSRYRQQTREMFSLWCDTLYKLSVANHFRDRVFFFPHNLDFRGRVYATPPHFNHLGSDVSRSILLFACGKPLGKKGLDWLLIHLVNLTGHLKREPNEKRLEYANKMMPEILDSADQPMRGNGWWRTSEEPWQTLACCMEVAKAVRSGNPEAYVCHFPVHQDGSCNGLQHYAALGRDIEGAKQVNLAPSTTPQDVYSGISAVVEQQRAIDAADNMAIAQVLEGIIKRKIVKQTVMTTVYGVTKYGAKLQILKRLKEIPSFPREHLGYAASYLAQKTFLGIGEVFANAAVIQAWFVDCANLISRQQKKPVEWVTPLGLPVVQPYFKTPRGNYDLKQALGIPNTLKQRNAFPPNFIHSLDSTHMMLTSLYCRREGIQFVAVHDCYWTHPCFVDAMNKVCREQFVALHSEPILEDLSEFLCKKFSYPDCETDSSLKMNEIKNRQLLNETLKRVPVKGDFNLEEVLKSTYFFS